jgi:hypothetical protein
LDLVASSTLTTRPWRIQRLANAATPDNEWERRRLIRWKDGQIQQPRPWPEEEDVLAMTGA